MATRTSSTSPNPNRSQMDRPTAVVLIDPYNEFLHPNGKLNPRIRDSLEKSDTIANLYKLIKLARKQKLPIYYCMHQQISQYTMEGWKLMNKSLTGLKSNMVFEAGSWGVEFFEGMAPVPENGDVVVSKHWNSSSFQSTDLDYQLRQRGIGHVVMAGLVANTCLESTARYAYEQ